MEVRSIDQLEVTGKRVLVRVDFNVPLDSQGRITDDTRIRSALPTIAYAMERGAKVLVASHLGRPKGRPDPRFSMAPCAARLGELLGKEVPLAPDCIGEQVEGMTARMKQGDVLMLENLRFHPEEEANEEGFARALARLADLYVNDGFAVAHRANASVEAITRFSPECAAGFLMKKELDAFSRALENPARPLVAILGGGKVADKLGAVKRLLQVADKVIIGGALAYTFLKAQGLETGASLVEEDLVSQARNLLRRARKRGLKLYLPVDCVLAEERSAQSATMTKPVQEIPPGLMALDIGPASVILFSEIISEAGTIIWNGPMGVYELEPFSRGTRELVRSVAQSKAFSILGGGDLDSAVHQSGYAEGISYISTGGGAFVELVEGKRLPGIQALLRCSKRGRRAQT
ncbi:MAG: phosphoglycerate kinase [Thermodesulfobacteriota bacterium]